MKATDVDTSGFQNIVLMLIGVLMIILISNVLTIISNPENIQIGALVSGAVYETDVDDESSFVAPKFNNMRKDPIYIDVDSQQLTVYFNDGENPLQTFVIPERDLTLPDNAFEEFLDQVEAIKDKRYIILLMRPGSAKFQRRLREVISDRGIGIGFEPWEKGRPINIIA
ncbi:MAG: hypothetical protein LBN38_05110 [Verrucomicrobiota bacterium]|jgi:hypothetical protein|nr:hypothetical protein [Verrucomicrobiota bacterium]